MPNALQTPTLIAQTAAAVLRDQATSYRALRSGYLDERNFTLGSGQSVKIRIIPQAEAEEFPGTYSTQDHVDGVVTATMKRFNTKKKTFTAEQLRMEIPDFTQSVILPAMAALGEKVSDYIYATALTGLPYAVGTPGTAPASLEQFMAPQAHLLKTRSPKLNRRAVIGPAVSGKFYGIPEVARVDARGGSNALVLSGDIGVVGGVMFYTDQTVDNNAHTAGTYTGGTVDGAHSAGETSIATTGGLATGTFTKGDLFTIAGVNWPDGTPRLFYVTTAVTAVGGAIASLDFYPALPQALLGNEAVTIQGVGTTYRKNLYVDEGFLAAVVMPTFWEDDFLTTNVLHPDGYGVTFQRFAPDNTNNARHYIFECFAAAVVVRPEHGCILFS